MTSVTAHLHVRVPCPQCGREMPSGQLARHQQGSKCYRAADVPPKLAVLACTSCNETVDLHGEVVEPMRRLASHTVSAHGRMPTVLERTPARREAAA
jgi:hypothetical protein